VVGGTGGQPTDFTALGDNVNITARLASHAGPGEILISDAAYAAALSTAAGFDPGKLEHRQLELKGKRDPIGAWVLRATAGSSQ
jgi:adenylate cyclase